MTSHAYSPYFFLNFYTVNKKLKVIRFLQLLIFFKFHQKLMRKNYYGVHVKFHITKNNTMKIIMLVTMARVSEAIIGVNAYWAQIITVIKILGDATNSFNSINSNNKLEVLTIIVVIIIMIIVITMVIIHLIS